jgi:hypothetical protein
MLNAKSIALIERLCTADDFLTYDPYDIWKTDLGVRTKSLYNCNRYLGALPASALMVIDLYVNNGTRICYRKKEYPIVRSLVALSLLTVYGRSRQEKYLKLAKEHIEWLLNNCCEGYHGLGWGLGFAWPVSCGLTYDANTPLSTATPYALEALVDYSNRTGSNEFLPSIAKVYDFFESDIKVVRESESSIATSYGPTRDRVVTNAVSYVMYSYSMLLPFVPATEKLSVESKIIKLYNFVTSQQSEDGSWLYSPDGNSFIDCFHSCIVLKNIIKSSRIFPLPRSDAVVRKGYQYLVKNLYDPTHGLCKRFSRKNKPSLVKFDLYDNAEMLNLAQLMGDRSLAESLQEAIRRTFHDGPDIYSQIDIFGTKQNKNMLRWAVMPYIYALSQCGEATQ